MAIRNILRPFGIVSRFGMLYQETSDNPGKYWLYVAT
jgi:hypothetical protein